MYYYLPIIIIICLSLLLFAYHYYYLPIIIIICLSLLLSVRWQAHLRDPQT